MSLPLLPTCQKRSSHQLLWIQSLCQQGSRKMKQNLVFHQTRSPRQVNSSPGRLLAQPKLGSLKTNSMFKRASSWLSPVVHPLLQGDPVQGGNQGEDRTSSPSLLPPMHTRRTCAINQCGITSMFMAPDGAS